MYEIKQLNCFYDKKKVLYDIAFSVKPGEFLTILGPNGSGKTTLLKVMTGFLQPTSGTVKLEGRSLNELSPGELARKIAFVSQDVRIKFPFTCLEVVMMGRNPFQGRSKKMDKEDLAIVHEAMETTETLKFADSLITEISMGEKQRVILARALAQTPEILFLDEAFSAMDVCYSIKSLNLLKKLVKEKNMTIVSVMHDLNMADTYSDTVLALNSGKIMKWGTAENVMVPSFIHSLFKIKVKKIGERGLAVLPQL